MKKVVVLLAALMLACSGAAFAKDVKVEGKVTAVSGKTVTVEVEKGKADKIEVGSKVEMEVKAGKSEKKAPKKGMDMLQGC